jgi:hypothetical protein
MRSSSWTTSAWKPIRSLPASTLIEPKCSLPEAYLYWGDQGVLYIGRGDVDHDDVWTLEWQCL